MPSAVPDTLFGVLYAGRSAPYVNSDLCVPSGDGTAVAVHVMTAYKGSEGIFLLFLPTALHRVSSTLSNYWIRAEWAAGRVWVCLEIWKAHSEAYRLPDIGT